MIRFIFLAIALYLAARIVGSFIKSPKSQVEVKGDTKKETLDLSDEDIQDVDYKEIKNRLLAASERRRPGI